MMPVNGGAGMCLRFQWTFSLWNLLITQEVGYNNLARGFFPSGKNKSVDRLLLQVQIAGAF